MSYVFSFDDSENIPQEVPEVFKDNTTEPIPISYLAAAQATRDYRTRMGIDNAQPVLRREMKRSVPISETEQIIDLWSYFYYDSIYQGKVGIVGIPVQSDGNVIIPNGAAQLNPSGLEIEFKPCPPCNFFSPMSTNIEFDKAFIKIDS